MTKRNCFPNYYYLRFKLSSNTSRNSKLPPEDAPGGIHLLKQMKDEGNNVNKDTRKHPINLTEYHISKENDLAMRENEMKFSRYFNPITE